MSYSEKCIPDGKHTLSSYCAWLESLGPPGFPYTLRHNHQCDDAGGGLWELDHGLIPHE